jgi:alanine-synthesizing transaminase
VTTHQLPWQPAGHHQRPRTFAQSTKLQDVLYEIRGPVHDHAARLEAEGHRILKLNIGNPASFGFEAPDVIMRDMIQALPYAQGYSDSKGILSARRAVVTRYELVDGFPRFDVDSVYLGNGVSELITMTLQALLDNGDQVLIPAPDYPLWTASASLAGGTPVHYLCDETNGWQPDIADLESKITPRTKAMVVINPNNPTGAVYSREVLKQRSIWRASISFCCWPTRSTTRFSTTTPNTSHWPPWRLTCFV